MFFLIAGIIALFVGGLWYMKTHPRKGGANGISGGGGSGPQKQ
jgi:hypothetical protein